MQEVFFSHQAQTTPYASGLEIVRAEGIYLFDKAGKAYADMVSGIGVSNLGHGNAAVVQAIKQQAEKHLHALVYGEFSSEAAANLCQTLVAHLPASLNAVYLVNSGTEANEAALKLVKRFTGRSEVIALKGAYHGSTHGSLSLSYNESRKRAYRPLLPDIRFIEQNNFSQLQLITDKTAGIFLETVQGDAGVRIPEKAWLEALVDQANRVGALVVFDEIQCGIGRTGRFMAFEHFGVTPHLLTLGKALGAGMPIGALVGSQTYLQAFSNNPMLGHITTFGGHPVVAAAAFAGLNELFVKVSFEEVEAKGQLLKSILQGSHVKAIRQIGLMLAVDLADEHHVNRLVDKALQEGIILFRFLSHPYSFRIAPPLTITHNELESITRRIVQLIEETAV